jgi:serine/threonine-protein kinase
MHVEKTKLINDGDKNHPPGRSEVFSVINPYLQQPLIDIPDGNQPVPLGSGVVTRVLGHGGMANVYEIWNTQLEIHKAVKLMHPSAGKDCLERFQTEIKICAKLNHPNIVEIHSVGEWHGLPYIEMERLEGITLENLLSKRGLLSPVEVIAAGIFICRGLDFAHNHKYQIYGKTYYGVIHRDLKPGNIMFCHDGQVKIMDFGIARPLDASLHTVDGGVVGTLQYLSPEQLDGGVLDVRTDLYVLGELLYESLCGKPAFPEKNITTLLNDKSKNRYQPLSDFHTGAPGELIHLIHKSMSRDREVRVSSAKEYGEALKKIGVKLGITNPQDIVRNILLNTGPKTYLQTRKRPKIVPMVSIAMLLLIFSSMTALLFLHTRSTQQSGEAVVITNSTTPTINQFIPDSTISSSKIILPSTIEDRPAIKKNNFTSSNSVRLEKKRPVSIKKLPPEKVNISPTSIKQKLSIQENKSDVNILSNRQQRSAIELLQEELGITDLSTLTGALYTKGRYKDVLVVYDKLSSDAANVPKTAVLALRSLNSIGNAASINRFLATHTINDAEFYLAQARQSLAEGNTAQLENRITLAESAPKTLLTYEELNCETSYLRALHATNIFNSKPNESTYIDALDKWRNLRAALSSNANHKYLQIEKEERKRMGQIYATLKDGH